MIGNDIVDLKQAAKESPDSYRDGKRHQRFLDKVFTQKEQQLILSAEDQHQMVWLLWSMKEAAYKVNVQQFEKRFFNPKRLECELISETKGMVKINNKIYFTTSKITEDYVYSVATLEPSKAFKSNCYKLDNANYNSQSDILKRNFLKEVSVLKKVSINRLKIKKSEVGVPRLFMDNVELRDKFSFTHCGAFGAFSI